MRPLQAAHVLWSTAASLQTCDQSYGFLPCSATILGSLFLTLVYGYLLLCGANLIGDGGEHLMDLKLGSGIIGGLVLPVIGALPDSIIILVAGLHGSRAVAHEQIAIGMGTLAGSTIMLLTIVWGGSVLCGRCNLDQQGLQYDRHLTRPWDLFETGVSTDTHTMRCAWAMVVTSGLYMVVQVPAWFGVQHSRTLSLVGCILCFVSLVAYCSYHVVYPEVQRRAVQAAHKHALRIHAVRSFAYFCQRWGGLLNHNHGHNHGHGDGDGSPTAAGSPTSAASEQALTAVLRPEVIMRLFQRFDLDGNGSIDESELRAMIVGLEIARPDVRNQYGGLEEHVALWMREFDKDKNGVISIEEFQQGLQKWVDYKLRSCQAATTAKFIKHAAKDPMGTLHTVLTQLDDGAACMAVPLLKGSRASSASDLSEVITADSETDDSMEGSDDGEDGPPWMIWTLAVTKFVVGTAMCMVFADPLVGSVTDLSRGSGIPGFFIAFVAAPLASNASELVSSLKFAKGQRSRNISITFNQVYGATVMNNTMCLGFLLLVLYLRNLKWDYGCEVVLVVLPTLALGAFGATHRSVRTVWGVVALAVYPLVLLMQYLLKYHWKLH